MTFIADKLGFALIEPTCITNVIDGIREVSAIPTYQLTIDHIRYRIFYSILGDDSWTMNYPGGDFIAIFHSDSTLAEIRTSIINRDINNSYRPNTESIVILNILSHIENMMRIEKIDLLLS